MPEYAAGSNAIDPMLQADEIGAVPGLDGGVQTIPWYNVPAQGFTSGTFFGAFLVSPKTRLVTKIGCCTAGTGATAVTYVGFGIYTVDAAGNITLAASTGNVSGTFGTGTFAVIQPNLTASYVLNRGQAYFFGGLFVGTGIPTIYAGGGAQGNFLAQPQRSGQLAGQVALPASVAIGSLGSYGNVAWLVAN